MSETREVIGVWAWESDKARSKRHARAREDWIWTCFHGAQNTPVFIWKVEFWRKIAAPRSTPERYDYGFTLHRFASNEQGSRYPVWVKAYDEHGHAKTAKLAAVVKPEDHVLADKYALPPEWLLRNNPYPEDPGD